MTDRNAVASRLRRLDDEGLTAFVAALWEARGFETAREDGVVVATRGGRELRIAPVAPSRFRLRRPSGLDRRVDLVVAPGGTASVDAPKGARVLDAADLVDVLWYALDAETRAQLCERHFGAAPASLAPKRRDRLTARLGQLRSAAPSPSFALGLGVAVLVAVLAVGSGALVWGGPAADASPATATETPVALPVTTGAGASAELPPPGVSRDGITNLSALAAAHATALDGRSYALWMDRYRRPSENGTRSQRDVDVAVADGRYLAKTGMGDDNDRRIVLAVYYDGTDWYVANRTGDGTRYARVAGNGTAPLSVPDPFEVRRSLVARYLSTPTTNVTGTVEENGRRLYRITGSGAPAAPRFDGVQNYTVTALVDRRGIVHDLTVTYVDATLPGAPVIRFEVTYGNFGEASVAPPPWYGRYFGPNATATPGRVNATESPVGTGTPERPP